MKVPLDAIIAREKLTRYLLVPRAKSDKSGFLAKLGFTLANPDALDAAIRAQADSAEAVVELVDIYGEHLTVAGMLGGPLASRPVVTVWIRLAADGSVRFVTLKPDRSKP
jgi:hypothetical protein